LTDRVPFVEDRFHVQQPAFPQNEPLVIQAIVAALMGPVLPAVAANPVPPLHVVPVPVKSYRLLAMTMDADGFIWAGSIHRVVHLYDLRTATVETIKLPYDASVRNSIRVGDTVYILGQSCNRLIIYDRKT
jgi:hypothetical protein